MISAISNTAGTTAQGAAGATAAPGSGTDFDTFLKMLTSQLKNQNPLNPMEGTEFAVQLATFSGVEQQAQTNKLLAQMVAQMNARRLPIAASHTRGRARAHCVWPQRAAAELGPQTPLAM